MGTLRIWKNCYKRGPIETSGPDRKGSLCGVRRGLLENQRKTPSSRVYLYVPCPRTLRTARGVPVHRPHNTPFLLPPSPVPPSPGVTFLSTRLQIPLPHLLQSSDTRKKENPFDSLVLTFTLATTDSRVHHSPTPPSLLTLRLF